MTSESNAQVDGKINWLDYYGFVNNKRNQEREKSVEKVFNQIEEERNKISPFKPQIKEYTEMGVKN